MKWRHRKVYAVLRQIAREQSVSVGTYSVQRRIAGRAGVSGIYGEYTAEE